MGKALSVIVEAYQHLICSPEWRSLYGRLRVAHLYGDANILADLISRARWAEFRQLCAMLGVRPQLLDISASVRDLYRVVLNCLRERSHLAGTARGVFNPHLIGDQPIAQGAASVAPTSRHLYDLPVDPDSSATSFTTPPEPTSRTVLMRTSNFAPPKRERIDVPYARDCAALHSTEQVTDCTRPSSTFHRGGVRFYAHMTHLSPFDVALGSCAC